MKVFYEALAFECKLSPNIFDYDDYQVMRSAFLWYKLSSAPSLTLVAHTQLCIIVFLCWFTQVFTHLMRCLVSPQLFE